MWLVSNAFLEYLRDGMINAPAFVAPNQCCFQTNLPLECELPGAGTAVGGRGGFTCQRCDFQPAIMLFSGDVPCTQYAEARWTSKCKAIRWSNGCGVRCFACEANRGWMYNKIAPSKGQRADVQLSSFAMWREVNMCTACGNHSQKTRCTAETEWMMCMTFGISGVAAGAHPAILTAAASLKEVGHAFKYVIPACLRWCLGEHVHKVTALKRHSTLALGLLSQEALSRRDKLRNLPPGQKTAILLLAGGVAGATAKTCVAPLERYILTHVLASCS